MSAALPESVDPWRIVQARRVFEGRLAIDSMPRLREALANGEGGIEYRLEFGTDEFGVAWLRMQLHGEVALVCQRTLDVFMLPVAIDQALGLIADEADEAGLPPPYEALLVEGGQLALKDVIEDELILALPVVALGPGAPIEDVVLASLPETAQAAANPFAALAQLKNPRH
ncbi:MAG TPA: YceD family protein [Dokdonella sp.]|uniref:YceD family protein n=1 Tax=Dokdonella sp. TaxID=2291710 RepID=UPI0025C4C257|nr:YceD family protein [Dokdonella sp.]MBX3693279.1 DUF177 domain-containing protein [Dokdonella sp.]MCW5568384.1 DUF177 domain-containing protein [Dokdonella sp.]HNR92399.1 YceD family protein [Dokdonella sp.]